MSKEFLAAFGKKKDHTGDYIFLKSIGRGSFAEVKLARHWLTGTKVAFKTISRRGLTAEFEEMKSLKTLHHPNIIALFEVISTPDKHILFMEHAGRGDLCDHLQECGRITEHQARPMFRQMISALHYCHHKGIVHRDLKPENILLDEHLNIKVADFGFSRDFSNYKLTTFCGTLPYMAPEILERRVYDGPKADVWSLGVILYCMVTGEHLFVGDTAGEVIKQIHNKELHLPDFTSVEIQELLHRMLTVDPSQRPTLDALMKDSWVNMGEDEEMRPYSETPWGDIDPQVAQIMRDMGFKKQEIQDSLTHNKYDRIMGTYLILKTKTTKMQGSTIKVRPCPSSEPSTSTSCSQEVEPSIPSSSPASSLDSSSSTSLGGKEASKKDPPPRVEVRKSAPPPNLYSISSTSTSIPEETLPAPPPSLQSSSSLSTSIPGEMVPAPPPSLQSSTSSYSPALEARTSTPLPGPQSGTATPSPALQCGPEGSPTTHSSSSSRSFQVSELGGGTPGSPSGHRYRRQGIARRVLKFFLKCICCRPSTKKRVTPV
ncbi:serine/threonine-protein kinase MARK2-like [Desmodus rotundus]|uniref:serine/threonine-protein kinase MARK2-like n=1 Tax=Desmodus rotundus TaxID=9430 RepID=UPI0039E36852